jgi:hypothetical protein
VLCSTSKIILLLGEKYVTHFSTLNTSIQCNCFSILGLKHLYSASLELWMMQKNFILSRNLSTWLNSPLDGHLPPHTSQLHSFCPLDINSTIIKFPVKRAGGRG